MQSINGLTSKFLLMTRFMNGIKYKFYNATQIGQYTAVLCAGAISILDHKSKVWGS